jgi:hypothetical protein
MTEKLTAKQRNEQVKIQKAIQDNGGIDPQMPYGVQRKALYPSLGEQLDKLWHDIDNDKLNKDGEFYKALKAVKSGKPKS